MLSPMHSSGTLVHRGPATHPSLHIKDAHDAHVLLEAVRLNILPLIKRRLTASEREQLRSGNVFVWEEADDEGGLLRWTDGRKWSQSRMRGDYLFYEEKIETTQEERDAKAARRAHRMADSSVVPGSSSRRKERPSKPDGLTKQTYSALAYLPGLPRPRKWHVVAYFSGEDYTNLPVIANYEYLRNIHISEGMFMSSKASSSRLEHAVYNSNESDFYEYGYHTDVFHNDQTGLGLQQYQQGGTSSRFMSSSPIQASSPGPVLPALSTLHPNTQHGHLPSLQHTVPSAPQSSQVPPPNYTPLSSEDRRVLNKFRVVL